MNKIVPRSDKIFQSKCVCVCVRVRRSKSVCPERIEFMIKSQGNADYIKQESYF